MAAAGYRLSAQVGGHSKDVRCVAALSSSTIATGSRDATIIIWHNVPETTTWEPMRTLYGHEHFVAALAVLGPPSLVAASGSDEPAPLDEADSVLPLLASAAYDNTVMIWDSAAGVPLARLEGHTGNVCSLVVAPGGELISGSWDATARVWAPSDGHSAHGPASRCVSVLEGHEGSVLALLADSRRGLPLVVSAGSDKTLRVWNAATWACSAVLRGHDDVVRGLALAGGPDSDLVASVANDGMVKMWSMTSGACVRTLGGAHSNLVFALAALPWSSAAAPSLVTGSEDKSVVVWSEAEPLQTIAFPTTVWAVAALPNGDFVAGCADGIARIFTASDARIASDDELAAFEDYASAAALVSGGQQVKLDELDDISQLTVVEGARDGETKLFRDGSKAVAYSWSAASGAWVLIGDVVSGPGGKEMLNGKYYDCVFEVDAGDGNGNYKLGYNHGENEYDVATRFCAENGLHPQFIEQVAQFIRTNAAPQTLAMGATEPAWTRLGLSSAHFPVTAPAFFMAAKGLSRAADKLAADTDADADALSDLAAVLADVGRYHSSVLPTAWIEALLAALAAAPNGSKFAAYDLLRMLVLHPSGATYFAAAPGELVGIVADGVASGSGPRRMLALRLAVNAFKALVLRPDMLASADQLLALVAGLVDPAAIASPKELTAALGVVVGYAGLATDLAADRIRDLAAIVKTVLERNDDGLAFRALTAWGTCLVKAPSHAVDIAVSAGLLTAVSSYVSDHAQMQSILADIKAFSGSG
ncbi:ubiquitin homeostasis protein lub1 [Thecamonas trahens ATCC 50062]|uniref:Ubiquitin homeostasis protein lub1 n=1 Tax=Thecamonas trahens ATCC 50062 TaxID=461836 RepID=A0A0L0DM66_THETB|nr:ubiquitin homeostasis protein lub1 [Thecamonas trahens ATCC 50062]KNC52483.1 ubiquitin homeostasis protein lub1 [Thecamonas trahens ATCC 50062]|eukprot:XP_013755280.1 ubiquitin homeostasis protein lub1 [Thecamonas trahens ATCC 50062]